MTNYFNLVRVQAKMYRFSLSWPRILPKGTKEIVNQAAIDYCNNVINELISKGIETMVTMFHWDLPQHLQEAYGGWESEQMVDIFGDYARLCFEQFGDRVKYWITFNEP